MKGTRQNEVGLPDREETVFHESVESRSSDGTIPRAICPSTIDKQKSKKGNSSKKKASSKKTGNKGASFDQDGEAWNAGWAQVIKHYKAAKKAHAKKRQRPTIAAKTDGASAAPQYTGESSFLAVFEYAYIMIHFWSFVECFH